MTVRTRLTSVCAALVIAGLAAAAPASAAGSVNCGGLVEAMQTAGPGEVLQLPAGSCSANVTLTNTNAFTLEGAPGGGTRLLPIDPGKPIVQSAADVTFTLKGLTFSGMNGASAISLTGAGEAVTISGNTFVDNEGPRGAALNIETPGKTAASKPTVISGNTFSHNHARLIGGAIVTATASPLTISRNTFLSNNGGNAGGAMSINGAGGTGPVTVTGNTFGRGASEGNTAEDAGGAAFFGLSLDQPLTLSDNRFEGNKVTGVDLMSTAQREGGALFLSASADSPYPVTQSRNTFIGNVIDATHRTPSPEQPIGGGAEWILSLNVTSTRDRFISNRIAVNDGAPPEGGAIGAFAGAPTGRGGTPTPRPALFVARDDLFARNSTAAGGWGGAIYVGIFPPRNCTVDCPPSGLTLEDSTVVRNAVRAGAGSEGSAIWGSPKDRLMLHNSIVSGNAVKPEIFGFGSGSPEIKFTDACTENRGVVVPKRAGNICKDPVLSTGDVESAGSPTLDAGSNALVPAGLTKDLAGKQRIRSCGVKGPAIVDMGAFEFVGLGRAQKCLDRTKPVVKIGRGPLKLKNGRVAVTLSCPVHQSFCDGSVRIVRVRGSLLLGKAHFHIGGGRSANIKVKLLAKARSRLGGSRTVRVVIKVSARDAGGRTGKSKRTLTLRLRS